MKASMTVINPDQLEIELTATLTLSDWSKVLEALEKRSDGHYGPLGDLTSALRDMYRAAHKTFREELK